MKFTFPRICSTTKGLVVLSCYPTLVGADLVNIQPMGGETYTWFWFVRSTTSKPKSWFVTDKRDPDAPLLTDCVRKTLAVCQSLEAAKAAAILLDGEVIPIY